MQKSHHKKRDDKRHSSKDSHEKEEKDMRKIVKKLIKRDASSKEGLMELFDTLDKGDEVDISGIEDEYLKQKLYKLLKLSGVPHNTEKYIFKLQKSLSYSLKNKIEEMIKRCKKSRHKKSEDDNKPIKKFKEEHAEVKEEEKKEIESAEDNFIGPMLPSELEALRNKQKRLLLEQYNSIFRPKSLLEEHQEKMKKGKKPETIVSKSNKLNEFMTRPFNRDTDLEITRIQSKEAFKNIRNNGTLDSKFSSVHFLHDK